MLRQLVYLSTASHAMSADQLDAILETSRRNNQQHGITGLLAVKDRTFIQVLEGEADAVKSLFNVIKDDPRHREVTMVSWDDIDQRSFPEWSMGFKDTRLPTTFSATKNQ